MTLFKISLLTVLGVLSITSNACQDIDAKALKSFKDKTGIDLSQNIQLPMQSTMTVPQALNEEWDQRQKKKWMMLLPTTQIADAKITDYRIFNCTGQMDSHYPCTKPLYQLRIQLNPQETCQKVNSDKMSITVLALAENKNLKILDYLFESHPQTHKMTPVGLMVLEDIEATKKEK